MNQYQIQFFDDRTQQWVTPFGLGELGKAYAEGYLSRCREEGGVRLAARLVRAKDGKVLDEVRGRETVELGMIAGFPTWDQYVRGAITALTTALKTTGTGRGLCGDLSHLQRPALEDALALLREALGTPSPPDPTWEQHVGDAIHAVERAMRAPDGQGRALGDARDILRGALACRE